MRRTKPALSPSVDIMEPRLLLSTAARLASARELSQVGHEVKAIVNTLARTDNMVQANNQLAGLASRISPNSPSLAVSWKNDIALYRPSSPWSTITTQKRIIADLQRYLDDESPAASGTGPTTPSSPVESAGGTTTTGSTATAGQVASGTYTPVPTPSLDSVRIQNLTGLDLTVTVYLHDSQNPEPYITETIPAQGDPTVFFNFGTSTDAFMSINIGRADGLPSPAPFDNVDLSQPQSGYNGTLFTITLVGPYFNVNFS